MLRIRRRPVRVTLVAGVALVLAACSSTGGAQTQATNQPAAGANQAAPGQDYTIQMITHETPGDTFWDKIRSGANDAAAAHGIKLQYSNNPQAANQAGLINNAIDSKVNGIATTLATPEPLKPAVQRAIGAGIPVVAFNSGINQYQDVGARMYFGSDEDLAGRSAGRRIASAGGQKPLCVIQAEGSVALEARCAGVKEIIPATENIQVNGADIASVTSTLQAKLQQDKSIDYVVTLGAPIAMAALQSKQSANSAAKLVTFDLNAEAAKAIQDGRIEFSIDQQPYLQGFLAVESLWLLLSNGNEIGGGQATLTGPSFVDSGNIAQITQYAARGTR